MAEEIRNLSERSAQASAMISNLIVDTQTETAETVKTMERNLEKVNVQLTAIQNSVGAMNQIVDRIQGMKSESAELLKIYELIMKMITSLEKPLVEISDVINKAASYSKELVQSANNQYESVKSVKNSADQLRTVSSAMKEDLKKYKT